MKLSKLKELLENGSITQEEYEAMAKSAEPDEPNEPSGPDEPNEPDDDLEERIQRAVDRATNKLGNENKSLREELTKLKNEKLTAEERAELEKKEKEAELEKRERELADKENRLYAVKAIKKANLDDGSDSALDLVEFVMDEDEERIDAKVKAFSKLVDKLVKSEVDRVFKKNGGKPGGSSGGGGGTPDNPYKKETFNLTKQMELELNDPDEAKRLKEEAGA